MEQELLPDFLVIDDDPINNMICNRMIQLSLAVSSVQTFTDPGEGLAHIQVKYAAGKAKKTILFLDINMPSMTGWEVLDKFSGFASEVQDKVKIFMLSSSVDPHDIERASSNTLVAGYITKSLSQAKLHSTFSDYVRN